MARKKTFRICHEETTLCHQKGWKEVDTLNRLPFERRGEQIKVRVHVVKGKGNSLENPQSSKACRTLS